MLSTGLITGKSYEDFTWEFLWYADDVSWGLDQFIFYASEDGISDQNCYILRIEGICHGNGVKLYKNGDFNNALAEYRLPAHMKTYLWDTVKYKVKIEAKDGTLKIWFSDAAAQSTTPVITYTLGTDGPTSGDFKIQGYSSKMKLEDMTIKTDTTNYYFDAADVPNDDSNDDSNDSEVKIPQTGDSSCVLMFVLFAVSLSSLIMLVYTCKRVAK